MKVKSIKLPKVTDNDVLEKLSFACRRRDDLCALMRSNALGSEPHERQQLIQEFFFHLIGAIEVLAQLVNERRSLGLDSEDVTVSKVAQKLPATDPLADELLSMYVRTREQGTPSDPYSDEGLLFRAYNYRHQVTPHRRRNPFNFRLSTPRAYFLIDPRDPTVGVSSQSVDDDLEKMLQLVEKRCTSTLALL